MNNLHEHIRSADWKSEKHVPVIECADSVKSNENFDIRVGLGKKVAHPNTTEHHIRWISLFFHPEDEKFAYQIGHFEFGAHGDAASGANQGPVYTHHSVTTTMKTIKPGVLHALAFCNIHGLWENSKQIDTK